MPRRYVRAPLTPLASPGREAGVLARDSADANALVQADRMAWVVRPHGRVLNRRIPSRPLIFVRSRRTFDVPGLVIYGGDDQVGPFSLAGQVSTAIIKGSAVKVHFGAPDGITGRAQAVALRRPARLNA